MSRHTRLAALAFARALQAGRNDADGLCARLRACEGRAAAWQSALAARLARLSQSTWERLGHRALAGLIERDASFIQAWRSESPPLARRHILRVGTPLRPPPLGLHQCARPDWPHLGALAEWLGISDAGLWRLSRPASWQRRAPLGQQHYRFTLLAKRSGGWRLLEVPEPPLRALQRQLLDDLLANIPPHEAVCGFRRGRSVLDHAQAHAGQAVILKFDLADFFGSVRASRVHAIFATLGYPQAVAQALAALTTVATPEPVLRRMHEAGQLTWQHLQRLREPHLPQGAPTSPALANLAAFGLDLRLDGLAYALGARYTRYADDIAISGPPHLAQACQRVERWVGRIAIEEGHALNHRKTRCLGAGRRQMLTGVVINRHANLAREEFDRLKAVLHQCVRDGPAMHNRAGHPDWRSHLQGRVAWAQQLNPSKAQRLMRLFNMIEWGG